MLYYARGSKTDAISPDEVRAALKQVFDSMGPKKRVLAIPPDFTRFNSYAGPITEMVYDYFGDTLTDVMPALGTHTPMTEEQIKTMYGHTPLDKFRVHDWRNDVVTVGRVPASYIEEISEPEKRLRRGVGKAALIAVQTGLLNPDQLRQFVL